MIFKPTKNGVICFIKVVPNASRTGLGEILKISSGQEVKEFLKVNVKVPALEGKANNELINFLSKSWGVKKSEIKIIKGETQSHKILLIEGNAEELLLKTLNLLNRLY